MGMAYIQSYILLLSMESLIAINGIIIYIFSFTHTALKKPIKIIASVIVII